MSEKIGIDESSWARETLVIYQGVEKSRGDSLEVESVLKSRLPITFSGCNRAFSGLIQKTSRQKCRHIGEFQEELWQKKCANSQKHRLWGQLHVFLETRLRLPTQEVPQSKKKKVYVNKHLKGNGHNWFPLIALVNKWKDWLSCGSCLIMLHCSGPIQN